MRVILHLAGSSAVTCGFLAGWVVIKTKKGEERMNSILVYCSQQWLFNHFLMLACFQNNGSTFLIIQSHSRLSYFQNRPFLI